MAYTVACNDQALIEEYIEKNCHRQYIPVEEVRFSRIWNAHVWHTQGILVNAEPGSRWSYRHTSPFDKEHDSVCIYSSYDGAVMESVDFGLDALEKVHYRVNRAPLKEALVYKWINYLYDSKGQFICIIDTKAIDPDELFPSEPEAHSANSKADEISTSELIDWLMNEGDVSLAVAEKYVEKFLPYHPVLAALRYYMETGTYDDSVEVFGHTAKTIHEKLMPEANVIDTHLRMVTIINEAKKSAPGKREAKETQS